MSFQCNRLILSAYVSGIALAFCMSAPSAQAGFEWTPPAENVDASQQQPLDALPPGSALPMPPAEVKQEQLLQAAPPMHEPPIKAEVPVLKHKTLEIELPPPQTAQPAPQPQQLPKKAHVAVAPPPAQQPVSKTLSRKKIIPAPTSAEQSAPPPHMTPTPETKSADMAIDPYPKETPNRKSADEPVVLPSDPKRNMTDVALEQLGQKPAKAQVAAPSQPESISWSDGVAFPVAEGFGTDIPLALALSQIVPPEYAYSFGEGVNPGQRVSWNGGKPWNEVLSDVLAPLNIVSEIKDKAVVLTHVSKQAKTTAPEQPPTPVKKKQFN